MPQADRDWILFTDEQPVVTVHPVRDVGRIQRPYKGQYMSARRYVLHTFADSKSETLRGRVQGFMVAEPCPVCLGRRLRPEALAVTFEGHDIATLAGRPLSALDQLLRPTARRADDGAAPTLARDLVARIEVLTELGLGYLSMDRPAPTLSSGELQRLRLATQLRSGLFGVVYVLDEPSAGLHPADTESLLTVLGRLKEAGNSLFVVEHDMAVVRRADWIVDVGPRAGEHGGQVLHSGPVAGLADTAASATRRFLFATEPPPARTVRRPAGALTLRGITLHNLRGLDATFPLGVFTAVTGVSGSGKSTLVTRVLADAVREHLGTGDDRQTAAAGDDAEAAGAGPDARAELTGTEGLEAIDRLVRVDQKPIGRTPRSNLATYTGLFDAVRKVFAATDEARARGYTAGRFSFNVAAGRCETCQGEGFVAVELLFLPGTYAPCSTCHGARYRPETLQITYRDRTVADVLAMTVDEAAGFLADVPAAARSLRTLQDVGLGYLRLGQPATELSGGEAQRIKLASELQRTRRGHTLYLLDEPTTGLHPADTEVLLHQLHGLVDAGHTVVVVEHDMGVVAGADHVIDLGPGGGADGGRIVATGTPAEVAAAPDSRTAPYLARQRARPEAS
ncbi:ABC transporter [Streptomyces kronopolitis]|uniref:ABC transporter n=1 Tax=Streptomyces kronopolitis TaxID=1612435 RepID=UPI0036A5C291